MSVSGPEGRRRCGSFGIDEKREARRRLRSDFRLGHRSLDHDGPKCAQGEDDQTIFKKLTRALAVGTAFTMAAAATGGVFAAEGVASGDTSGEQIAFSNSYAGNSFRQLMIRSFEEMAAKAEEDGVIAGSTVVSSNDSVPEQAAPIQNLVLQGYDAIIVLAGSDTALNGAIRDACDDGHWTSTVAQKEVSGILPSLPKVDAVLTQGGDGYGAAQAFKAAGRELPIIIMGNRQDELALWKAENEASGYETFSLGATPSISQVAFWVAQQILAGKEVPKFVEAPLLEIYQPDLDAWLAAVPEGGVVNAEYPQELVAEIIDANVAGADLPKVPAPN